MSLRLGDTLGSGEHVVTIGRTNLGSRTYGRGGSLYGTTARCTCGWRGRVNVALSRGGAAQIKVYVDRHLQDPIGHL